MPWSPADAKKKYKRLTKKQSEVWASVANAALEKGDDDATAIKKANAAVKRMSHSEAIVDAVAMIDEAGRMISSANLKKLKDAMKSMTDAMAIITPLMADNAQESIQRNPLVEIEQQTVDIVERWENVKLSEASKILAQSDSYDSIRYAISCALRKRAISDKLTAKVNSDSELGYDDYYGYADMPYIRDLYDDFVVYSISGELYQSEYTYDDGAVTLGDATEVKLSYVPVTSSSEAKATEVQVSGDLILLKEAAVRSDGTARIKLISPGWGSSGYYSEKLLKRDGPKIFKRGTHMYMNHPTDEEDRNRPERDVRDLAGVISSEVKWEDAHAKNTGPGLYADANVFSSYRQFVDEAAEFIGTSIRAGGLGYDGEVEGKQGIIIDSLKEGYSVDFVTMAGRGGQVLTLYESARKNINIDEQTALLQLNEVQNMEDDGVVTVDISKEEFDKLRESANKADRLETALTEATTKLNDQTSLIGRMNERMIVGEARTIIAQTLATINDIPNITKDRLLTECARTIPLNDDKQLNKEKLVELVKEAAVREKQYIESISGSVTGGTVTGITQPTAQVELNADEVDKELENAFKSFGLNEKQTAVAVQGRKN